MPFTGAVAAVAVEVGIPALRFFPVPSFTLSQPLLRRVKCSSENAVAWPGLTVSRGLCPLSLPSEEQLEVLCVVF